ncbi:MAG: isopentenyl phosphate kinase [Candidatus Poseidonia sp.]|nr:isopentenyl phosphate kinase [Poseidonia sp.]
MRERVVVKWGGGLITQKDTMKTVRHDVLENLAEQLEDCLLQGLDVVLVHGAGSFGHLKAKAYHLAEGRTEALDLPANRTQEQAVEEVRQDMLELNEHVMAALTKRDVSAVSLPPHQWARNTGPRFQGDLTLFESAPQGIVLVTHGDVVDCDEPKGFGILSGDDLVYRLATELSGVKRLVFAMGGVEGVLQEPPNGVHDEEKLIETLHVNDTYEGEHMRSMDVTGGIGLKVQRGFETAEHGVEVLLVSGEIGHRVRDACLGDEVRGTTLRSS